MRRSYVSDVRLMPGSWRDAQAGLLGYVQFVVGGVVRVDGLTLRRTRRGRLTLSYPIKKYTAEAKFHVVCPVNDEARREVERQVLACLGLETVV